MQSRVRCLHGRHSKYVPSYFIRIFTSGDTLASLLVLSALNMVGVGSRGRVSELNSLIYYLIILNLHAAYKVSTNLVCQHQETNLALFVWHSHARFPDVEGVF